eukprot:SAG11_NODE_594_length_8302_cov_1.386810_2_plen_179_part_00
MNCLNRHESFLHLRSAWNATGNPVYSAYFSALAEDWVRHLPCRSGVSRSGWDAPGGSAPCATGTMESPWRVLECGIRTASTWPLPFFGFQQAAEFTTSARVMMILGFSEHNAVLNGPGRSAHTPNWAIGQCASVLHPPMQLSASGYNSLAASRCCLYFFNELAIVRRGRPDRVMCGAA